MNRKDLLRALIAERFGSNDAAFARAIKRSPAQVIQWLTGHRKIGDAGARLIELALELPAGYFDPARRVEQKVVPYVVPPAEDKVISEVVALMKSTDEAGRNMCLAAVKVALHGHKPTKANRAS
jgi:putative lipase involved disintegration of autophagic bodies